MTTFRIEVVVDPTRGVAGAKRVRNELDQTEKKADTLQAALKRAFAFIGVGLVVRELVQLSDAFTNAQNKLRVVVAGEQELVDVTRELFEISNRTRSSFQGAADIYSRVALATKDLGTSQKEVLEFTESLNQAIILSGASGAEAEAGLIQLSQGLASGALRGDELRSVLEQLPAVADVIAKSLGVTRGELREMGQEGKITADVVLGAFKEARQELADRFAKTVPTIGQGFQVLQNNVLQFIGSVNEATGASAGLATVLVFMGDNIELVATGFGVLALAMTAQYVSTAILAATTTTALTARIAAMNAAIAANPIGVWTLAIAAVTAEMVAFGVALIEAEEQISKLEAAGNKLELTEFAKVGDDIMRTKALLADAERTLASSGGEFSAAGAKVEQYREKLRLLNEQQELLRTGQAKTTVQAQEQQKAIAALAKSVSDLVGDIEQENGLLALNSREREIQAALLKEIAALNKGDGPDVTEQQKAEIEAALRRNLALREQDAILQKIRGPQQQFEADLAALEALFAAGKISLDEYNRGLTEIASNADGVDLTAIGVGGDTDISAALAAMQDKIAAAKDLAEAEAARARVLAEIRGPEQELLERQEILRQLYESGAITLDEYNAANAETIEAIKLLNPEYAAQKALLEEINGPTQQLEDRQRALDALFAQGAITAAQYDAELAKINAALHPLTEAQQLQADILERLNAPQQQLVETQAALNALLASGAISADEYAIALNNATIAANALGTSAEAGLAAGLARIENHLLDVGGAVEASVVDAFREGEDALVSFVRTGKADFSGLVNQILDDLARLATQQLLLGLFGGGGTEGLFSGLFGGARAEGGPVDPGKAFLVGEKGPELFAPKHAGNVVPAGETAAMMRSSSAAPIVNVTTQPPKVTINNISDPSEIPRGIESAEGEQAIMNVVSRKRRTMKGLIG